MKRIVPLEKMSKKEQRRHHLQQRGSWNGIIPVSHVVPSGKVYKRTTEKAETRSISRQDL